jgi:crotonobetainyl-CoA:carnitine CoA-transferase CaiB-like acyl-CoA transferase
MSGNHLNMNRNKRSVAIDLKLDAAKGVLRKLTASADLFIHNMRPQAIEQLGFGYAAVAQLKPDIVYVGAYGFGGEDLRV